MKNQSKGLLAVYLSVALLATTGIFAKGLPFSSIDITFGRAFIAACVLLVFALALKIPLKLHNWREISIMSILGVILIIHWATFFEAMRVSTVAIGMTTLYTYPLFTVVIEAVVNKRTIELRDAFIAAVVFLGIYIISPLHAGLTGALAGITWGVLSAILFAIRNVAQRRWLSHHHPICSVFYQSSAGFVFLAPFSTLNLTSISVSQWWGLIVLGIFFTATPHVLLATSLRYLNAKTVAFIGCLQPVLGTAIAIVLINEWPSWNIVIGATLVLGSAVYETLHVRSPIAKVEVAPIPVPSDDIIPVRQL